MTQVTALSLLVCGLQLLSGCGSTPEPTTRATAGGPIVGSAGTTASSGGGSGGSGATSGGSSSGGDAAGSTAGVGLGGAAAGAPSGGQAGSGTAGSSSSAGSGGTAALPPLEECKNQPSIDRLTQWTASGEGATVPATGSILVADGADYVGKVQFVGAEWHVIPVLVANQFDVTADLSKSSGITLTYSATAELHVQLRSKSHWSGGDQYATTIPSTGGEKQTHFFSFSEAGWKSLFGAPALSFADTLKEGMGLVFVGNSENMLIFYGLRIDGYTPPCQ